ncbi:hypothetical protein ACODT5_00235 [Streptomyces sp. 5.8]|uniref:hypothetical protein n=1 Tax=Streptomyces sp. 5.8 TaxID=3406571 RepID=UPI003BB776BA
MNSTASTRRLAALLNNHGPHMAGAVGLAGLALIVLPVDGFAEFVIALIAGIIGGELGSRVAAHLMSTSNR